MGVVHELDMQKYVGSFGKERPGVEAPTQRPGYSSRGTGRHQGQTVLWSQSSLSSGPAAVLSHWWGLDKIHRFPIKWKW